MSHKVVNTTRKDWYLVREGEETAKAAIQTGELVIIDPAGADADGNKLIPLPTASAILPMAIHLADGQPRPNDGAIWGDSADDPENYIYAIGETVQRVQTFQGEWYNVWVRNDSAVTPLTLVRGDRLKPSTTTPGHMEVVTPDEATLAGVVDLKNSPFIVKEPGADVATESSSFVLVERV